MYRFETIDLGTYRGGDYFLAGFVEPEPLDGEEYDPDVDAAEYGIVLARSTAFGPNVEIVRLDTAHGQGPHVDRVYLSPETDGERKIWLDQSYTYGRMKRYLLTTWRRYVDLHLRYSEQTEDG